VSVPRIAVVAGPTGVGKSDVALELAELLGGEIVGADSVQLYRLLDIGSAKPTAAERARVPHHLVDVIDPREPYTAADFSRDAARCIDDIHARGAVPLLVGGTALYVRAVLRGICEAPGEATALREEINARAAEEGWPALHAELARTDPAAAARIHPNDRIRIERALEVALSGGGAMSERQAEHAAEPPRYEALHLVVNVPRDALYARIDQRVQRMLDAGWFAEVEALLGAGYDADLKPLQAIGYRDVVACLRGEIDRDEAVRRIQRDTRRFAKRQLTWLRKEPGVRWYLPRVGLARELAPGIARFLAGDDPGLPEMDESAKP